MEVQRPAGSKDFLTHSATMQQACTYVELSSNCLLLACRCMRALCSLCPLPQHLHYLALQRRPAPLTLLFSSLFSQRSQALRTPCSALSRRRSSPISMSWP